MILCFRYDCKVVRFILLLSILDWNQFRGPDATGLAAERADPPIEFGPQSNVLWKTALPPGKSSPVFAGDRIFLTAHQGEELLTICLNRRTGQELWRRAILRPRKEARHKLNDPAAPTASPTAAMSTRSSPTMAWPPIRLAGANCGANRWGRS